MFTIGLLDTRESGIMFDSTIMKMGKSYITKQYTIIYTSPNIKNINTIKGKLTQKLNTALLKYKPYTQQGLAPPTLVVPFWLYPKGTTRYQ